MLSVECVEKNKFLSREERVKMTNGNNPPLLFSSVVVLVAAYSYATILLLLSSYILVWHVKFLSFFPSTCICTSMKTRELCMRERNHKTHSENCVWHSQYALLLLLLFLNVYDHFLNLSPYFFVRLNEMMMML